MGAADMFLFALLALADFSLLFHLHRRRTRRLRSERMMRSLRSAIHREIGVEVLKTAPQQALVLQRAS